MAQIDVPNTAASIASYLGEAGHSRVSFSSALRHSDTSGFGQRGIVMCYDEPEGIGAIARAYSTLKEKPEREVFGKTIADAINRFASFFPEGEHNLCYAHFLLHGIARETLPEVVEQIRTNARIIHEMIAARDTIEEKFGPQKQLEGGLRLQLCRGQTDDFHGLSFQLYHPVQSASDSHPFAKAGFFIDTTNNEAIIVNVQGRKNKLGKSGESLKQDRILGREFARFAHYHSGQEPRVFVLNRLCDFLTDLGIKAARVIRPEEHVMHIGKHPGFHASYDEILKQAGFEMQDVVYRAKVLLSA